MAHRADLHRLLMEQMLDGTIVRGAHCVGVTATAAGACAAFADGRTVEADVVIGADGINSVVRENLLEQRAARYTQQMAWRCMVPIACVPTKVGRGGAVAVGRDEYVGWIGPEGHVICYPIRGGETYNILPAMCRKPGSRNRGPCRRAWTNS
jgi:salicylate hydroxylase